VTLRGGLRRAIPFLLVRSRLKWVRRVLNSMRTTRQNGPAWMCISWRKAISRGEDNEGASDRRVGKSRPDPRTHVAQPRRYTGNSGCSCFAGFEKWSAVYRGVYSGPAEADGHISWLRLLGHIAAWHGIHE